MIIADAGRTEDEMRTSEQQSQDDYAKEVAATTNSINADREAIAEKEKQLARAKMTMPRKLPLQPTASMPIARPLLRKR